MAQSRWIREGVERERGAVLCVLQCILAFSGAEEGVLCKARIMVEKRGEY